LTQLEFFIIALNMFQAHKRRKTIKCKTSSFTNWATFKQNLYFV